LLECEGDVFQIFLPDWTARFDDPRDALRVRPDYLAYLLAWGAPHSDFSAAELAFDELVANVVRHAAGPIAIAVEWTTSSPILNVCDRGPGFTPHMTLPACAYAESGRGLYLVAALAGPLSVLRIDGGSCVSVTLPVYRHTAAPALR
jgi:anti-sigma regulatory factor (Ser/Thr protein kinase)